MSRADRRRRAATGGRGPVTDADALARRIRAAKLPGTPPELAERAKKALEAFVESAAAQGVPLAEIARHMADGRAAATIAHVEREQATAQGQDPAKGAACAAGCAFCCILSGEDGGTITAHEAERLHAALAPRAGEPDGRDWHPNACPALDPATRMCRAYEARPLICRSYHSADAAACEANAAGEPAPGARLAGAHLTYLAAHGLARAALGPRARVETFALREVARAAVEGQDAETALAAARHGPPALDAERRRTGRAWTAARGRG
ncbi:YkgJ family cysteine cluster protein [Rhodovulum sp. 12E13]|nr:YkgJ family cysteine cluster protein [Rhodovulum sp. 12E13]